MGLLTSETLKLTEHELEAVTALRHDLHRHPELSGEEFRTTEKIQKFLSEISGCEILELPIKTGLVARIAGNDPALEVMLRADIDALPQTEQTEIQWRSQSPGIMHACGHDLHAASLCGAALLLGRAARNGSLRPTVDLVFQPAEEVTTGAATLINAGLFDRIHPQICFGLHNWPSVETGRIVCREGALMAAKRNFDILIRGVGGHGSKPHLNIDPIVCAAAVVQSLQTVISRNTDPLDAAILSINMIQGGSPVNLVVDKVLLKATVRALSDTVLERNIDRVMTIVAKTAEAYECQSEIRWQEHIPAVWNAPDLTVIARRCAEKTGCELTDAQPSLASEDFSMYRAFVPSFFFWVGSRAAGNPIEELHTPRFCADDLAIRTSAELYAACASVFD